MRKWIEAFCALLFPPCCVACGAGLRESEACICFGCNTGLPRTHFHLQKGNAVELLFWGRIPVEQATSFFFYSRDNNYTSILHALKYRGRKEIGEEMGRMLANEIFSSGFFNSVDVIIPIPLHPKKEKARGYNQSEWIAKGISEITRIPVDTTSLSRIKHTETQTQKSRAARWENVCDVFALSAPEDFTGKHLLIVDDVLTTGATVGASAAVFKELPGVKISVLTLALVQ